MKNETKSTPGPWEAYLSAIECHVFEKKEGRVICKTPSTTYDGDAAECIANAQLIAACPTMFSALKMCQTYLKVDVSKRDGGSCELTNVEAALVRAEDK